MDVTVRPLEERDFAACLELLRGHLAYPGPVLEDLPRAWSRLLRDDCLVAAVIEDGRRSGNAGDILCFGASVFVTDEWMAAGQAAQEPYLAARTIRQELSGRSPILRPPAIRRGNASGGLNIVTLHYAEPRSSEDVRIPLRYRMAHAFVEATSGYRIKALIQEFWDELPPEFIESGSWSTTTDYTGWFERRGLPHPPPGQRPILTSFTREEVLAKSGNIWAPVFVFKPPRLCLTRAEQAMLRQALLGYTDIELAACLHLALPTVKSRWRMLYEHVGGIVPKLVPEVVDARDNHTARGPEKRRRLLEYLRQHPEELRPGLWRPRSSARARAATLPSKPKNRFLLDAQPGTVEEICCADSESTPNMVGGE